MQGSRISFGFTCSETKWHAVLKREEAVGKRVMKRVWGSSCKDMSIEVNAVIR